MRVPVAVCQPCELLYTWYLLTYLLKAIKYLIALVYNYFGLGGLNGVRL